MAILNILIGCVWKIVFLSIHYH